MSPRFYISHVSTDSKFLNAFERLVGSEIKPRVKFVVGRKVTPNCYEYMSELIENNNLDKGRSDQIANPRREHRRREPPRQLPIITVNSREELSDAILRKGAHIRAKVPRGVYRRRQLIFAIRGRRIALAPTS